MLQEAIADIATLDIKPSAVVLSIGIVLFNLNEDDNYDTLSQDGRSLYLVLDGDAQINEFGRTVSFGTVKWWLGQNKAAQTVFASRSLHPKAALEKLVEWLAGSEPNLWGNGSSFDNVILNSLFADYGVPNPFKFWKDRDLRTLQYIAGGNKPDIPRGIEHNALDDAQFEVLCAQEYMRRINGTNLKTKRARR